MKPSWGQNEGRRHEEGQWFLEADFSLPAEERLAVQQHLIDQHNMADMSWDEWGEAALVRDKFTDCEEKILVLQRTEEGFQSI